MCLQNVFTTDMIWQMIDNSGDTVTRSYHV